MEYLLSHLRVQRYDKLGTIQNKKGTFFVFALKIQPVGSKGGAF
jgi:hypothetical protein